LDTAIVSSADILASNEPTLTPILERSTARQSKSLAKQPFSTNTSSNPPNTYSSLPVIMTYAAYSLRSETATPASNAATLTHHKTAPQAVKPQTLVNKVDPPSPETLSGQTLPSYSDLPLLTNVTSSHVAFVCGCASACKGSHLLSKDVALQTAIAASYQHCKQYKTERHTLMRNGAHRRPRGKGPARNNTPYFVKHPKL
jgi:hypothetical protein